MAAERENQSVIRRLIVPRKSWFPGVGHHVDVHVYKTNGNLDRQFSIPGAKEELDTIIEQYNQEFFLELKKAMALETTIYFFERNTFGVSPPQLDRAAKQVSNISKILIQSDFGSQDGHSYKSLLKEISVVSEKRKGKISLAGWRSKLLVAQEGSQEDIFLSMSPDSHPKVIKRFEQLAFIVGYDKGKYPLTKVGSWNEALRNWDSFTQSLSFE